MTRFFKRIGAILLSGTFFVLALFVILRFDPASATGWSVFALFLLLAVAGTFWIYRGFMGADFGAAYPDAGTGEGYATGIGAGAGGSRRRRDEGEDIDTGSAAGRGSGGGEADDPGQLS